MSDLNVPQVMVNQDEYKKFCYLIKVMDALDRADKRAGEDIDYFKSTQGVKADRRFDWNQVSRFCAPQLLISFLRGAERWEDERSFREYPHSVIIARTAYVVVLDEVFELTLETEDVDNNVADTKLVFSQLRKLAQASKGMTALDVEPLIRKLERALAPK
jgi:hypothetical protein